MQNGAGRFYCHKPTSLVERNTTASRAYKSLDAYILIRRGRPALSARGWLHQQASCSLVKSDNVLNTPSVVEIVLVKHP